MPRDTGPIGDPTLTFQLRLVQCKIALLFTVLYLATTIASRGQSSHEQSQRAPRQLTLVEAKEITSVAVGAAHLTVKCDTQGNIYLLSGVDLHTPLTKLSPDGQHVTSIPILPMAYAQLTYFEIDQDGTVHQLASIHEPARYIFHFDSDGAFKSKTKLTPGFEWVTTQLASFPSGDFLVAGMKLRGRGEAEHTREAFTGIFSSDGNLLKEIRLEDDQRLHAMAEKSDSHFVSPLNPENNRAFSGGSAESAQDGNVYLMRNTSPLIVYAISAGGEVLRRFTVDSGDRAFSPLQPLHISGERMAVLFHDDQTGSVIIKVVNLSGQELATYRSATGQESPGPVLACYSLAPDRFTFLGRSDSEYLVHRILEPR